MPVRVLEHDDGGVDNHADAERQPAEGHRVERKSAEVEQGERSDDRHWNRRADDERRSEIAQEREDDEHNEHAANQRVLLHVVDGVPDIGRRVLRDDHPDAGHLAVDALDLSRDGGRHGHGVLAGLLLHLNLDARLAVDPHERTAFLGGVEHIGDITQVNRHSLARENHQVADVVDTLELPLAAQQEGGVALVNLAERRILIFLTERLNDSVHRQVEGGDLLLRQLDVDLPPYAAVHRDGSDAIDTLEARRDIVLRDLPKRDGVVVTLDA